MMNDFYVELLIGKKSANLLAYKKYTTLCTDGIRLFTSDRHKEICPNIFPSNNNTSIVVGKK